MDEKPEQKWEKVIPSLYRFRVPGGWLYEDTDNENPPMCFVPDPDIPKEGSDAGE